MNDLTIVLIFYDLFKLIYNIFLQKKVKKFLLADFIMIVIFFMTFTIFILPNLLVHLILYFISILIFIFMNEANREIYSFFIIVMAIIDTILAWGSLLGFIHPKTKKYLEFSVEEPLRFSPRRNGELRLVRPLPGVPPQTDLCLRAARLLRDVSGCRKGVNIHVEKRLPMGGSLGGGSSKLGHRGHHQT